MIDTTKIKENMTVYDTDGDKLGTVAYVQYTDENPNNLGPETASFSTFESNESHLVKSFAKAIIGEDNDMPEEVRKHLMHTGYIRLETNNIFETDYYIPLNQVSAIMGENVHLETSKDDLLTV